MAKDKQKKLKVPKTIAGVKVPKKARKTANKALEMAENPLVRQVAIAALTAAAAALAENKVPAPEGLAPEKTKGGEAKLGDLVAVAAMEGARRLFDKARAAPAQAEASAEPAPAKPKAKKLSPPNGAGTGSA